MSSWDDAIDDAYDKAFDPAYAEEIRLRECIAELEATIARLRGAAKIVIDEHTRLVEINATGGSEAIDGLEEALRESGDG